MELITEKRQQPTELSTDDKPNPFVTSKLKPFPGIDGTDLSTTKLPPLAKLLDTKSDETAAELPLPKLRLGRNAGRTQALGNKKREFADLAFARAMARLISEESRNSKTIAPVRANAKPSPAESVRPVELVPVGLGVLSYDEPADAFPNLRKKILTAGVTLTVLISAAGIMIGRGIIGGNPNAVPAEIQAMETAAPAPISDASSDISPKAELPVAKAETASSKQVKPAVTASKRLAPERKSSGSTRIADAEPKPQKFPKQVKVTEVRETSTSKVTRPRIVSTPK